MEKNKRRCGKYKTPTLRFTPNEVVIKLQRRFFEGDNFCIDYFLEAGVSPEIFKSNFLYESESPKDISDKLTPEIICKFPNFDKINIAIEKSMINQIFPHGLNVIESTTIPEPNFYCLVLDNQTFSDIYTRKYLACLNIYESIDSYKKLYEINKNEESKVDDITKEDETISEQSKNNNLKYKNYYIPKCLCIVSLFPYINKYEEILRELYAIFLSNKYPFLFLDNIIEKLVVEIPKIPRGLKKVIVKFPNKIIDLSDSNE